MTTAAQSPVALCQQFANCKRDERVLLLTPGPHGKPLLPSLIERFQPAWIVSLDSDSRRIRGRAVLGRATRLPFKRHSFDTIVSIESLFAIRPPWTVIAEFHRILSPDGKLILIEPAEHGMLSRLRDRFTGPGKRVFSVDEIKFRLGRADFSVEKIEETSATKDFALKAYCVRAIKKENPAEPVPQFLTAKEMIERRKKKVPEGDQLP